MTRRFLMNTEKAPVSKPLSWGIVALSPQGLKIAYRVAEHFPCDIFVTPPLWQEGLHSIQSSLKGLNSELFRRYHTLVYVMATGIVIREIAHCFVHKSKDPAIIVIDGRGEYVISLLSGHLGGANHKARMIAEKIKAQAVITTMSDVTGHLAVDMIAQKLDSQLLSFNKAKELTAMMIRGEKVAFVSDWPVEVSNLPDSLYISEALPLDEPAIWLTNKRESKTHPKQIQLIPKNIVLGIGCRRGTPLSVIEKVVFDGLNQYGIHPKAISKLVSIHLKKDEEGLLAFSSKYQVALETYPVEVLLPYESLFDSSSFVKKIAGVGAVSETSGYFGSNFGRKICEKIKTQGMTLSVWEENKCFQL